MVAKKLDLFQEISKDFAAMNFKVMSSITLPGSGDIDVSLYHKHVLSPYKKAFACFSYGRRLEPSCLATDFT